jgi:hypothetical protein
MITLKESSRKRTLIAYLGTDNVVRIVIDRVHDSYNVNERIGKARLRAVLRTIEDYFPCPTPKELKSSVYYERDLDIGDLRKLAERT